MNRHTIPTLRVQQQNDSSSLGQFLLQVGHLQRLLGDASSPSYFQERSLIAQLQRVDNGKKEDLRMKEGSGLRKGMMDTFSRTERTVLSEEDSEYLNYLKQYETVIKNSRRKEYISPSRQKQEMHDLISEFLSDLPNIQPSPSPKHDKPTPVKIEKIDLTYLQPRTPKINQTEKQFTINIVGKDGSRSPARGLKDEPSPRFANLVDKSLEKNGHGKKKEGLITPVKVQLLKVSNAKSKIKEGSHPQLQYRELCSDKNQQGEYRDSYLKKKQAKVEKYQPPKAIQASFAKLNQLNVPLKPKDQKTGKKPIKIQIEIPVEDLEENSIESSVELDNEQREIIKQISQKVKTLLHKTNAG